MRTYTLKNDFHNTEARVRCEGRALIYGAGYPGGIIQACEIRLTKRQLQRVWRTLCGIADCPCGGIRGPQRTDDGKQLIVDAEFTN